MDTLTTPSATAMDTRWPAVPTGSRAMAACEKSLSPVAVVTRSRTPGVTSRAASSELAGTAAGKTGSPLCYPPSCAQEARLCSEPLCFDAPPSVDFIDVMSMKLIVLK